MVTQPDELVAHVAVVDIGREPPPAGIWFIGRVKGFVLDGLFWGIVGAGGESYGHYYNSNY